MKILNLGCGTKASARPEVTNIDWSIYLRLKRHRLLRFIVPLFVKGERLDRFNSLPDNVVVHDLAKGLPFEPDSIDVVYHSHLLEHLDRDLARGFLLEVRRVLKPGGIQRIVVPDLERACRDYISHIAISEDSYVEGSNHDSYVAAMIEQSVRREAYGTSQQKPVRSFVENTLLGDARRRGETHQWMYDRVNLCALLVSLGYTNPQLRSFNTSLVPNWERYGLDLDDNGNEYKPGSLYMEAQK
jgi:SAM-dependent methyltransferase